MQIEYRIPSDASVTRLLDVLKKELKLSSRFITKMKAHGRLLVNGIPYRTIDSVYPDDLIFISLEDHSENYVNAEDISIDILFEDDWFLAVNKPSGMPVHPSAGHTSGTLANAVQWHFQKSKLKILTRPVNRLDRDTSGITLFAKHSHAQDQLIRQMKLNTMYKEYLGIVEGVFVPTSGTINLPIARKPGSIMERIIHPDGDRSITHYETVIQKNGFSLVRFVLETGRTHQIRVHAKAEGHPLLGDWLYSDNSHPLICRQALHSHKLCFIHPASGKMTELTASLPEDMLNVLNAD